MLGLPRSVLLASWASSWLAGDTSIDDAIDRVRGSDEPHGVSGMGTKSSIPIAEGLQGLRAAGATAVSVALPRPGDPSELAGPPEFNAAAVVAGEAAVAVGAPYALVPQVEAFGPPGDHGFFVTWQWWDVNPADPATGLADADRELRQTLLEAGDLLVQLDVASWRPEVEYLLTDLRSGASAAPLPHTYSGKAQQLAARSARILAIVRYASADDGGSITGTEANARRTAIAALDHAARRGLCAAANSLAAPE